MGGWGTIRRGSDAGVVQEHERLPMRHGSLERPVDRWVNHRPDQIPHSFDRGLCAHLFLIWPRRGHGIVDLHRPDDAGTERNGFPARPSG